MIHCHCFEMGNDKESKVIARVETILGSPLENVFIHNVRDVAPDKDMFCVTFQLPAQVAFAVPQSVQVLEQELGR